MHFDFYLQPLASIYNAEGNFVRDGNLFPDLQGNLQEIVDWIRHNPLTEQIELLRSTEYKSREYVRIKEQELMFITPHCRVHTYRENKDVKSLSGILYYDVDKLQIKGSVEEHKAAIIAEAADVISVVGVSAGGVGLFIYLQVEGITVENFNNVYEYYRTEVLGKLLCFSDDDGKCILDINAKGIVRPQIVSVDRNLYYKDVKLKVPESLIQKGATRYNTIVEVIEKKDLHRIAPFSPIPINKVLNALRLQTFVDTGGRDYIIEKRRVVKLYIHRVIPVGMRKKLFSTYTNILTYINPEVPVETILSFIDYINQNRTCGCPMSNRDMQRIVVGAYNHTKKHGLWNKSWEKDKFVHLSENWKRGKNRKEICTKVNQLIGELKVNRTIEKIEAAITELLAAGRKVTGKALHEVSGVSLRTIKTYYTKESFDMINGKIPFPQAIAI